MIWSVIAFFLLFVLVLAKLSPQIARGTVCVALWPSMEERDTGAIMISHCETGHGDEVVTKHLQSSKQPFNFFRRRGRIKGSSYGWVESGDVWIEYRDLRTDLDFLLSLEMNEIATDLRLFEVGELKKPSVSGVSLLVRE